MTVDPQAPSKVVFTQGRGSPHPVIPTRHVQPATQLRPDLLTSRHCTHTPPRPGPGPEPLRTGRPGLGPGTGRPPPPGRRAPRPGAGPARSGPQPGPGGPSSPRAAV